MTKTEPRAAPVAPAPNRPVAPPSASQTGAPAVWVGWVAALTPDGLVRRKVRIPAPHLATFATEDRYPPDHRTTVAIQIQSDIVRDDFLEELSRAREGR